MIFYDRFTRALPGVINIIIIEGYIQLMQNSNFLFIHIIFPVNFKNITGIFLSIVPKYYI
jgi:hypothetical protein